MNTSLPSRTVARLSRQWTCSTCRSHVGPARGAKRMYSQFGSQHRGRSRWEGFRPRRSVVLLASGGAAAGAGVLAFTDEIKQKFDATERSGRVAAALGICVNDYRTTLNEREKVDDPEEKMRLLRDCHKRCAERTLKVLEQNGGIFIKLGQHLSAMNYLLPTEWTTTFVPLQDKCPVSPLESIEEMFRNDTQADLHDYFSDFSPEPIGAASLAQVHLATIKESGQRVAVKVQHPSLQQFAPLDLALTKYTFSTLKWIFPEYDLEWLSSEMEVSLPKELDFTEEAANAQRTKEYFAKIPSLPLVIPDVLWAQKRILVMAYEAGRRPDDLEFLDSNGIDRDEVSAALARIFNEMIFGRDAPLHCDPHGGNIAIRKNESRARRSSNFDVILYDHGLYRDIPVELRRSYAKMWLAVIDGDMTRMRQYAREVAGITDDEFPLFASAITGRDFTVLSKKSPASDDLSSVSPSILTRRGDKEKKDMSAALQEGLLADLVGLLGRVPRIILLILKTNDLTRSLDENLHTREGPVRTFLILARYCSRTVLEEKLEEITKKGSFLWPANTARLVVAWLGFLRVEAKLELFELWVKLKRRLGWKTEFKASL